MRTQQEEAEPKRCDEKLERKTNQNKTKKFENLTKLNDTHTYIY